MEFRNVCCAWLSVMACAACAAEQDKQPQRCGLWIDLCQGEPVTEEEVVEDLAGARVIYLGEQHTLLRHHELQARIFGGLARRGIGLALGLEQLESFRQPTVDQFNQGRIDFEHLAQATDWPHRWPNYQQYRPIVEAARKARAPLVALNARSETIRQVARSGGVARLSGEARQQLPAEMQLDDPLYAKLLGWQLMVHMAATPERLRPMIEAQIARDESMAAAIAGFLQSPAGQGRTMIVLCGSGHVAYGLGTAARVHRRLPQIKDRIVLLSESGDLELSPEERAVARPVQITHQQLRDLGRPIGDYLHATSLKPR